MFGRWYFPFGAFSCYVQACLQAVWGSVYGGGEMGFFWWSSECWRGALGGGGSLAGMSGRIVKISSL